MALSDEKKLICGIIITLIILISEVIGGIISNSLALLSDAGHVFTDAGSLFLSLIAIKIMKRSSSKIATFGFHRVGELAALINGVSLIVISVLIFLEAYKRMITPEEVRSGIMLIIAIIGLFGNLLTAFIIGHKHESLNIKSAWLHVFGDAIASLGVILAGIVIKFTGWYIIDPIISVFVGLIIIAGGIGVTKQALRIFLELSPLHIDLEHLNEKISQVDGVLDIHDVHLWSIGHGIPAFSAHIKIADRYISDADKIRKDIEHVLFHFGVKHTVIQIECEECGKEEFYCRLEHKEEHIHNH
jgi:cobalt-zinc-cadmium efflux system protein